MGEIIRNIKQIKLGNESFMLELNEGYTKEQGQIIHIQNKDFRYVLTVKEFLRLSAMILAAKEEMISYKKNEIRRMTERTHVLQKEYATAGAETEEVLASFAELMHCSNIEYRLLEKREKIITVVIKPSHAVRLKAIMRKNRMYKDIPHMYGRVFGYGYIYQMIPFKMYELDHVFIEVFFQLPCMSLTPKIWIPLDKAIQARLWKEDILDGNYHVADPLCQYIFRLTWAIFKKGNFDSEDITFLVENENVLDNSELSQLLKKVFFNYSEELINRLKKRNFQSLIIEYYKFNDY